MIWFLKLVILLCGKNFTRKTLVSSSHAVIDPRDREWSHTLALSLSEKGKKWWRIASVEAPLIFNMSHTSRKMRGASWEPPLVSCQTDIVAPWNECRLELKVICDYRGHGDTRSLATDPRGNKIAKCSPLWFLSVYHVSMDVPSSNLSPNWRCLFNQWKVLSILGSNSTNVANWGSLGVKMKAVYTQTI